MVGLLAFRILPVSALPEVDYPTVEVITFYNGASPKVMTATVTTPLERQLGQIPGLLHMASTSSAGVSVIVLRFALGHNLDVAQQDVQAAINTASGFLPNDLPAPPVYHKVNPADAPVLSLALVSSSLPLARLQELADTRLVQKLSQISGVGLVTLSGGQRRAIRIQANVQALSAYHLGLEDLRLAVEAASTNQPKGSVETKSRTATLNINDQLLSAEEYGRVIVSYRDGRALRLADVATVLDDVENSELAAWANHTPALLIDIQRQPGSNVIEVVDRINRLLPQLRTEWPASIELLTLTDRTLSIRASIRAVQWELLSSIALVILVIFLFLRSLRATSIPAVVVPLSLIGTFAVMYLAGFSLNNLSLMALTIATGFVVDDAIVVIENIARRIEAGETPLQAALKGSRQIGFTIVSLTLSLVAVLIPVLFMEDLIGQLFREFAITLAVAILISALISLSLTPMMCAKILKRVDDRHEGRWMGALALASERLIQGYGRWLAWVLRHPTPTLTVAGLTLLLTALLYVYAPKGFLPQQDTGLIQAITRTDPAIGFKAMTERQQSLVDEIIQDPAVARVASMVGVEGINTSLNQGRLSITLKPHGVRQESVTAVMNRLKSRLDAQPLMQAYLQPVQDLTLETRPGRTRYQFILAATQATELSLWTRTLLERLAASPALTDLGTDLDERALEAHLEIDRAAAARWGVSVANLDNTLYDAFGPRLISTLYTQSNQYRVVLEARIPAGQGPEILQELRVASSTGNLVPLTSFARLTERTVPVSINHLAQFPAATFYFNPAPGHTLEAAMAAIEQAKTDIALPQAMRMIFQGAAQAFQTSLTHTAWLILAAIVTVYIVLGVLYESYIHPLTILSTLPSAGLGALLALRLAEAELGLMAVMGIILLIGIVKKNAIMMIDFALEAERKQGKTPLEAITQASIIRFRPILMTTLAALLGALPLMLGTGVGSELRHPLGITLVGGLLLSQLLTLFTTPVIYLRFSTWIKHSA